MDVNNVVVNNVVVQFNGTLTITNDQMVDRNLLLEFNNRKHDSVLCIIPSW